MKTYLEALDLWEVVEENYDVLSLSDNPTMNQIRIHKEKKTKKEKSCLFAGVSQTIFTRIMALKSANAIWDYQEMQMLNLMREFELQKMKESETVKDYTDKSLGIANKIRLLGGDFANSRIVEIFLVTVPKRYEASIVSLENTKDLSKITLAEVVHALQAQEQRRLMREDRVVEGALQAKHHDSANSIKKNFKKNLPASNENGANNQNKGKGKRKNYPPCQHCGKMGQPPFKCWRRPNAKCSKYNQLGHEAVICKRKFQQPEANAQVVEQNEEDYIFVATCYLMRSSSEC
eukprot:XP_006577564.1 uncharacterized protein LOC102666775 [Glycine max]